MVTTAYPYLRFSDPQQGKGDSTRRQSTWHEETARREGWTLDYSFRLKDEGRSAYHGDHLKHDLGRFLAAINAGEIKPGSVFMFEEMDRLSRQKLGKAFPLFVGILTAGVNIRTREKLYTEESLNDLGDMVGVLCKMHTAHDSSEKTAMRIKSHWDNWRQRVLAGDKVPPPGLMPCWIRWTGKAFERVEEMAATIRLIHKWSQEGLGQDRIAAKLNAAKLPAPGDLDHRRFDSKKGPKSTRTTRKKSPAWTTWMVLKVLRGREVLGDVTLGDGRAIAGFYPEVISEQEWWKTQAVISSRTVGRKGKNQDEEVANLLSGIVFDARDGYAMHLHISRYKQGQDVRSLCSSGALEYREGSKTFMVPHRMLENAILRFVRELKPSDFLDGDRGKDEESLTILEGKIADLKNRIDKIKGRVASGNGDIDAYLDLIANFDAERKQALSQWDEIQARLSVECGPTLEDAQTLLTKLRQAKGQERDELREKVRARIKQLVESIWVLPWDVATPIRACDVQVNLRGGNVRALLLAWCRGGKYPGLSVGIGHLVGKLGHDSHLADKRLNEYRSNAAVQEFFQSHHANLTPAIKDLIQAEMEVRQSQASLGTLDQYLAEEALDDKRPPVRSGGRPPKAK